MSSKFDILTDESLTGLIDRLVQCTCSSATINSLTPEPPVTVCKRLHCFKKLQLSQLREHRLNYQL